MTSQPDLPAQIEAIRDTLAEAKRYISPIITISSRVVCVDLVLRAVNDIQSFYCDNPEHEEVGVRLVTNLLIGQKALFVDSEVLIGYIHASSYELACVKGRIEREMATKREDGES